DRPACARAYAVVMVGACGLQAEARLIQRFEEADLTDMLVVRRLAVVALSVMLAGASFAEQMPLDNTELANVLERVLATHPSADAARAEVSAARSELSGASWARFPGVSVETFADDRDGGTVSAALQVDMPLWTGGRLSAEIRQSKSRLEAALASLDEVYLDLALRTVQSY